METRVPGLTYPHLSKKRFTINFNIVDEYDHCNIWLDQIWLSLIWICWSSYFVWIFQNIILNISHLNIMIVLFGLNSSEYLGCLSFWIYLIWISWLYYFVWILLNISDAHILTLSTKARSHSSMTDRGISPVGTTSGFSCNLSSCWSTYEHLSGTIIYGSFGHWFPKSIFRTPPEAWNPPSTALELAASHINGIEARPNAREQGMVFIFPQPRHWIVIAVHFAVTFLAEITIFDYRHI